MINLEWLRKEPKEVIARIAKKDPSFDGKRLYDLDKDVRDIRLEVELLQAQKNELAKEARTGVTPELREQSKEVSSKLKDKSVELQTIEQEFRTLYFSCPNLPESDVPAGGKEKNTVIRTVGSKPAFNFEPKNHLEIAQKLGWLDFETASKITGSNFALYKDDAVKLMYSLALFMYKHNIDNGYQPILPSVLVNEKSLEVSGNFPKFKDQVYVIEQDNLFLSPTSEVSLTNLYRDHIFTLKELPIRMTAWTSCFRREAGTYGANERGLIRIHQFEKVELVTLCEPEKSNQELERMLACAETILQKLNLHYRVSLLASQDISFQAAKTYDIEVWLPGQKEYYEVSSASNCTDFQARRGLMRYKDGDTKKSQLIHTLNASSLALPRLMVALIETYQQPDGSVAIPDVLKTISLF